MTRTVEFSSRRSPAHLVRTTGHKFVAGRLIVAAADAPAVRAYAARFPAFGIREVVPAPPPRPARQPRPVAPARAREAVTQAEPAPVPGEPIAEVPAPSGEGHVDDVGTSLEDTP